MGGPQRGIIDNDQARKGRAPAAPRRAAPELRGANGVAAYILQLQRTAGNQAVGQLLRQYAAQRPVPAAGVPGSEATLQRCGATPCACSQEEKRAHVAAAAPGAAASSAGRREELLAQLAAAVPVQRGLATLVQRNGNDSSDRSRQSRPRNAPTGTKPIDQSGLGHDAIHDIKDGIGAGPKDWVGITPDGHVITGDGEGNAEDHGPAEDYTHNRSNQGNSEAEQRARDALPSWVWVALGAAATAAVIACFATGVCEAGAIIAAVGAATAEIIMGLMEAAGIVFGATAAADVVPSGGDQQPGGGDQQPAQAVAQADQPAPSDQQAADDGTAPAAGQDQTGEQDEQAA